MSHQDYEALRLDNYLVLMGLVPLYWDHFLTFDDEVRYFWKSPFTKGVWCFFINRYLAAIGHLVLLVLKIQNYGQKSCGILGVYHPIHLLLSQIVVAVILGLRVYALFGCQKIIGGYLAGLLTVLIGVAGWSSMSVRSQYDLGCTTAWTMAEGARVAVAWECLLVWDINIFAMILWKHHKSIRFQGKKCNAPLFKVLIRDGMIYFGIMVVANLLNIMTYYFTPPRVKGVLSTFSSTMSVTMMSRLMINLNFHANGPPESIVEPDVKPSELGSPEMLFRPRPQTTIDDNDDATLPRPLTTISDDDDATLARYSQQSRGDEENQIKVESCST